MNETILGHERLDVYKAALELLATAHKLTLNLRGRAAILLRDQLLRAAISVMLNIAEGNGEHHSGERAKFLTYARRSAEECAACLDGLVVVSVLQEKQIGKAKHLIKRIVEMLVRMIQKADPTLTSSNHS